MLEGWHLVPVRFQINFCSEIFSLWIDLLIGDLLQYLKTNKTTSEETTFELKTLRACPWIHVIHYYTFRNHLSFIWFSLGYFGIFSIRIVHFISCFLVFSVTRFTLSVWRGEALKSIFRAFWLSSEKRMQCVHLLLVVFYLHFSLEISLIKKNEGLRWPELIIGDTNGELIMDTEMSECLMHLTSEEMVRSWKIKYLKFLHICMLSFLDTLIRTSLTDLQFIYYSES